MDRLEGIKIFVRVVQSGSFSAVARELGAGQPAISKQVAALEEHHGCAASYAHLPQSEPDRGRARLLRICRANAPSAISKQRNPASVRDRPRRLAWCASPPRPASLAAMSCRNCRRSARAIPTSSSRCWFSERTSNLVEEGIDLAIRDGALAEISLIARKIGEFAVVAVASAEYLERRGEPTRLSDLDRHDGVIFVSQDGPPTLDLRQLAPG